MLFIEVVRAQRASYCVAKGKYIYKVMLGQGNGSEGINCQAIKNTRISKTTNASTIMPVPNLAGHRGHGVQREPHPTSHGIRLLSQADTKQLLVAFQASSL